MAVCYYTEKIKRPLLQGCPLLHRQNKKVVSYYTEKLNGEKWKVDHNFTAKKIKGWPSLHNWTRGGNGLWGTFKKGEGV